jgi:ABC-type amino acid transport substrate-binding protein
MSAEGSVPNSLKVSPPLLSSYKVNRYKLKGFKTIKKRISVGAIKGVLAQTKAIIRNRSRFGNVEYYKNYKTLIDNLYHGKIDSILMSEIVFTEQISKNMKAELELVNSNLYSTQIFHYINKKHANILEKLSGEFEIKKSKNILDYKSYLKKYKKKAHN